MRSPEFRATAEKLHMFVNPITGEELERNAHRIVSAPPGVVARFAAAMRGP